MSGFVFDSSMTDNYQVVDCILKIVHGPTQASIIKLKEGRYIGVALTDIKDFYREGEIAVVTDGFLFGKPLTAVHVYMMYKEFKEEAFAKLNGGFNGFIVDDEIGKVFFIKDRYGFGRVEHFVGDHLACASELKALLPSNTNPMSCHRLYNGLYIEYDYHKETYEVKRYFEHVEPEENKLSFQENAELVREAMYSAIDEAARNVTLPVGVALSGIDSMVVAHRLNEKFGVENVKLFTVSATPEQKKSSDLYNLMIFSDFYGNAAYPIVPDTEFEFSEAGLKESAYFFERNDWDGFSNGMLFKLVNRVASQQGVGTVFTNENIDVYFGSGPLDMAFFYDKDKFWHRRTKRLNILKCINHRSDSHTTFISPDVDHNFVTLCNTVPNMYRRYSGYGNKSVFRKAFENDLDESLIKRPKIPSIYGAGVADWFTSRNKEDKNFFFNTFKSVFDNGK